MKTIVLILQAIKDLIIRYLPVRTGREGGFAFIVHPRDISDTYRKWPFLRSFPESWIKWFLRHFWPIVLSEVEGVRDGNGNPVKGWLITIPLTAKQMLEDRKRARKMIVDALKHAEKLGARIAGLGALTSSLTRGGLDVKNRVNAIRITTGRFYTVKIIIDTLDEAERRLGLKREHMRIAIVGAAGFIGSSCSMILSERRYRKLILIDIKRKFGRLKRLADVIGSKTDIKITHDILQVKDADIVITATNHPATIIRAEHLKPGTVVIDDAQPSDIDPEVVLKRRDIMVLEGGVVHAPGLNPHFNMGLKHREDIYSCLAETIILAVNDDIRTPLGFSDLDIELLHRLSEAARALGFRVGDLQNLYRRYAEKDIEYIKDIILSRKQPIADKGAMLETRES